MTTENERNRRRNRWFFGGMASSTAVLATHPLDLLKVQLQTQAEPRKSLFQVIKDIYVNTGRTIKLSICWTRIFLIFEMFRYTWFL